MQQTSKKSTLKCMLARFYDFPTDSNRKNTFEPGELPLKTETDTPADTTILAFSLLISKYQSKQIIHLCRCSLSPVGEIIFIQTQFNFASPEVEILESTPIGEPKQFQFHLVGPEVTLPKNFETVFELRLRLIRDTQSSKNILHLDYNASLFLKTTIHRIGVHLCHLINQINQNPSLKSIQFIPSSQLEALDRWYETFSPSVSFIFSGL